MIIRLFFLLFRWVDRLRASPLQHRCRTIDTSIVALVQLCKHPHSLLRSQAHYESFNLQPLKRSKTNTSSSIFLPFGGLINLGLHYFEAFLYKHLLVRRRNARSSGDEEGSAEHQTRVRSCGCAVIFLHLRNEWHNEATPLNVREPSVALPVGLCRMAKGGNT